MTRSYKIAQSPILTLLVFCVWSFLTPLAWAQDGTAQYLPIHPEPLLIYSNQGVKKARIAIEIAETETQKQRGLMFRPPLAPETGMLFPYDTARRLSFWMHNTPSSLDILFINPDKKIMAIHPETTPLSKMLYPSGGASLGALELNAGESERLGLTIGDMIQHPRLP